MRKKKKKKKKEEEEEEEEINVWQPVHPTWVRRLTEVVLAWPSTETSAKRLLDDVWPESVVQTTVEGETTAIW